MMMLSSLLRTEKATSIGAEVPKSSVHAGFVQFIFEDGKAQSRIFKCFTAILLFLILFQNLYPLSENISCAASGVVKGEVPADHEYVSIGLLGFIGLSFSFALYRLSCFASSEFNIAKETKDRTGNRFDFREYFLYRLDYLFSSSPYFKVFSLLFVTCVLIIIGGLFWCIVTGTNILESLWTAWTFVADPGTHADSATGMTRFVSLLLSLGGMVIFALVIGIVSEDVGTYVENLRKGTSRVIESGHTLIIGQGDKLIPTIQQICLANESEGGKLIVVLTILPKQELEGILMKSHLDYRNSNVIVRTGSPHIRTDLQTVSAFSARSIIVLADRTASDPDAADVAVVRTVLSLRAVDAATATDGHITVEMCDIDNEELVTLVGDGRVETVVSHDIIGRLMIQCARRKFLAQVLESLLGFEGSEFYMEEWPEVVGRTFREVMLMFKDAVVVGIMRFIPVKMGLAGTQSHGVSVPPLNANVCSTSPSKLKKFSKDGYPLVSRIFLSPPLDMVVEEGDKIIVIAEDNDTYKAESEPIVVDEEWISKVEAPPVPLVQIPEKILFVGWRRDMDDMIEQLDSCVSKGSELTLFSSVPLKDRESRLQEGGLDISTLSNITLKQVCGNSTCRRDLETLPLAAYDSVLILADESLEASGEIVDMIQSDSHSLTSLILIRDIQAAQKRQALEEEIIHQEARRHRRALRAASTAGHTVLDSADLASLRRASITSASSAGSRDPVHTSHFGSTGTGSNPPSSSGGGDNHRKKAGQQGPDHQDRRRSDTFLLASRPGKPVDNRAELLALAMEDDDNAELLPVFAAGAKIMGKGGQKKGTVNTMFDRNGNSCNNHVTTQSTTRHVASVDGIGSTPTAAGDISSQNRSQSKKKKQEPTAKKEKNTSAAKSNRDRNRESPLSSLFGGTKREGKKKCEDVDVDVNGDGDDESEPSRPHHISGPPPIYRSASLPVRLQPSPLTVASVGHGKGNNGSHRSGGSRDDSHVDERHALGVVEMNLPQSRKGLQPEHQRQHQHQVEEDKLDRKKSTSSLKGLFGCFSTDDDDDDDDNDCGAEAKVEDNGKERAREKDKNKDRSKPENAKDRGKVAKSSGSTTVPTTSSLFSAPTSAIVDHGAESELTGDESYISWSETDSRGNPQVGRMRHLRIPKSSVLISEILDTRTKSVASVASLNDYVTSNELVSMALAMVSEQREVNAILKELFSAYGNEIFLHPAVVYVREGSTASFFEMMLIGKKRGHQIIGYRTHEGKVVLNPTDKFTRIRWSKGIDIVSIHLHLVDGALPAVPRQSCIAFKSHSKYPRTTYSSEAENSLAAATRALERMESSDSVTLAKSDSQDSILSIKRAPQPSARAEKTATTDRSRPFTVPVTTIPSLSENFATLQPEPDYNHFSTVPPASSISINVSDLNLNARTHIPFHPSPERRLVSLSCKSAGSSDAHEVAYLTASGRIRQFTVTNDVADLWRASPDIHRDAWGLSDREDYEQ